MADNDATMRGDDHVHSWEDAWGASCVDCDIDLLDYASWAEGRIAALEADIAAMRASTASVVAAQDAVKSAEMRWHQVTRTDSYLESEVRQADRERVMALRARDEAIEQARAFLASAGQAESDE